MRVCLEASRVLRLDDDCDELLLRVTASADQLQLLVGVHARRRQQQWLRLLPAARIAGDVSYESAEDVVDVDAPHEGEDESRRWRGALTKEAFTMAIAALSDACYQVAGRCSFVPRPLWEERGGLATRWRADATCAELLWEKARGRIAGRRADAPCARGECARNAS